MERIEGSAKVRWFPPVGGGSLAGEVAGHHGKDWFPPEVCRHSRCYDRQCWTRQVSRSNPAAGLVPISHGGHVPAHSSCEQEKHHDAYGKQRRHRLTPRNRHVFSPHGSFTPKASSRRVCRHQQVNHGPGGIPAQPYLAAIDEVNHRCQRLLIVRCYLAHCLN